MSHHVPPRLTTSHHVPPRSATLDGFYHYVLLTVYNCRSISITVISDLKPNPNPPCIQRIKRLQRIKRYSGASKVLPRRRGSVRALDKKMAQTMPGSLQVSRRSLKSIAEKSCVTSEWNHLSDPLQQTSTLSITECNTSLRATE